MIDWKEIAGWLWGLVLVPILWLWKRADSAVTKEDFIRHENEDREAHRDFREQLKDNADIAAADRQSMREAVDRLLHEMHAMHISLQTQVAAASAAAAAAAAAAGRPKP